jgi:hypothetical protein
VMQYNDLPHQNSTRNEFLPHIKIYPKSFRYVLLHHEVYRGGGEIIGAYFEREKGTH